MLSSPRLWTAFAVRSRTSLSAISSAGRVLVQLRVRRRTTRSSQETRSYSTCLSDAVRFGATHAARSSSESPANGSAMRTRRCEDVKMEVEAFLSARGYGGKMPHHVGHIVGPKPYMKPAFELGDKSRLDVGVICTLEPGLYFEGDFGIRVENDYLGICSYFSKRLAVSFSCCHICHSNYTSRALIAASSSVTAFAYSSSFAIRPASCAMRYAVRSWSLARARKA